MFPYADTLNLLYLLFLSHGWINQCVSSSVLWSGCGVFKRDFKSVLLLSQSTVNSLFNMLLTHLTFSAEHELQEKHHITTASRCSWWNWTIRPVCFPWFERGQLATVYIFTNRSVKKKNRFITFKNFIDPFLQPTVCLQAQPHILMTVEYTQKYWLAGPGARFSGHSSHLLFSDYFMSPK